jgi:hypothetical protein
MSKADGADLPLRATAPRSFHCDGGWEERGFDPDIIWRG